MGYEEGPGTKLPQALPPMFPKEWEQPSVPTLGTLDAPSLTGRVRQGVCSGLPA